MKLGSNVQHALARITAELPIGIEPHAVADQPRIVAQSIDEFMLALGEAIAIVLLVSFLRVLIASWFVAVLFAPVIGLVLLPVKLHAGPEGSGLRTNAQF